MGASYNARARSVRGPVNNKVVFLPFVEAFLLNDDAQVLPSRVLQLFQTHLKLVKHLHKMHASASLSETGFAREFEAATAKLPLPKRSIILRLADIAGSK